MRDTEFGRGCPLDWPSDEFKQPNEPMAPEVNDSSCYRSGVHASIKDLLSPSCQQEGSSEPFGDAPPIKLEGGNAATLEDHGPREEFGLLVHDKQGWRAYSVGYYGNDRHAFAWDKSIHSGPAVYLVFSDSVEDEEEDDVEHSESYSLCRVLAFRCPPGRTQTFRWDAAVNKLVPARWWASAAWDTASIGRDASVGKGVIDKLRGYLPGLGHQRHPYRDRGQTAHQRMQLPRQRDAHR